MPSPFPGMDPYLENPHLWKGIHHVLITFMWQKLNRLLPRGYKAFVEERLYVVSARRNIYADVLITEAPGKRRGKKAGAKAAVIDPPRIVQPQATVRREGYIEIRRDPEPGVVTALELLSPSNKTKGDPGFQLYRTKQRELLRGPTNLVEIDLLRRGRHTVAVPQGETRRQKNASYIACLHRANHGRRFEVWEWSLRQRLPVIAIPLREDDPDVGLDLQALLEHYYDEAYPEGVDYNQKLYWPLEPEDATWAEALLRARGLRDVS